MFGFLVIPMGPMKFVAKIPQMSKSLSPQAFFCKLKTVFPYIIADRGYFEKCFGYWKDIFV